MCQSKAMKIVARETFPLDEEGVNKCNGVQDRKISGPKKIASRKILIVMAQSIRKNITLTLNFTVLHSCTSKITYTSMENAVERVLPVAHYSNGLTYTFWGVC
ncbi:unnamed protein product [Eretmochelys imbricata]